MILADCAYSLQYTSVFNYMCWLGLKQCCFWSLNFDTHMLVILEQWGGRGGSRPSYSIMNAKAGSRPDHREPGKIGWN